MKKIFITGATGFLGSYLLKRFLDDPDAHPIVLARGKRGTSARERIKDSMIYFYGNSKYKPILARITVVEGEIDKENFGISEKTRNYLIDEVDEIYHSAAIAQFRIPLDVIRKINVNGTRNMLEFAMICRQKGNLKKFNHISTTYVGGTKTGIFHEDDLDVGQSFHNTYEQSKFEAEKLVQEYSKQGLRATIFRPSILTGDSQTGKTSNFKMLYQPLHFFAAELFDMIPATRETHLNLNPVDFVANAIYTIACEKESKGRTFHISNPRTISAGHFVDVASDFLGFKKPEFIPQEHFDMGALTEVQRRLIEPYIPYFNYKLIFDSDKASAVIRKHSLSYPVIDDSFLVKLFEFCVASGFIKPKQQYVAAG